MFIKNQKFKDEATLIEMLFDFSLGNPSELIDTIVAEIDKELENNTEYIKYKNSLLDEEDQLELYIEERDAHLADRLLKLYDSFAVEEAKLYAVKSGEKVLLYELDLY